MSESAAKILRGTQEGLPETSGKSSSKPSSSTISSIKKESISSSKKVIGAQNINHNEKRSTNTSSSALGDNQGKQLILEAYLDIKKQLDQSTLNQLKDSLPNDEDLSVLDSVQLIEIIKAVVLFVVNAKIQIEEILQNQMDSECSDYEASLQKLEAEIREHIRIQQQLQLYAESTVSQLEDLQKVKDALEVNYEDLKKKLDNPKNNSDQIEREKKKDAEIQSLQKELKQKANLLRWNEEQLRNFKTLKGKQGSPALLIPNNVNNSETDQKSKRSITTLSNSNTNHQRDVNQDTGNYNFQEKSKVFKVNSGTGNYQKGGYADPIRNSSQLDPKNKLDVYQQDDLQFQSKPGSRLSHKEDRDDKFQSSGQLAPNKNSQNYSKMNSSQNTKTLNTEVSSKTRVSSSNFGGPGSTTSSSNNISNNNMMMNGSSSNFNKQPSSIMGTQLNGERESVNRAKRLEELQQNPSHRDHSMSAHFTNMQAASLGQGELKTNNPNQNNNNVLANSQYNNSNHQSQVNSSNNTKLRSSQSFNRQHPIDGVKQGAYNQYINSNLMSGYSNNPQQGSYSQIMATSNIGSSLNTQNKGSSAVQRINNSSSNPMKAQYLNGNGESRPLSSLEKEIPYSKGYGQQNGYSGQNIPGSQDKVQSQIRSQSLRSHSMDNNQQLLGNSALANKKEKIENPQNHVYNDYNNHSSHLNSNQIMGANNPTILNNQNMNVSNNNNHSFPHATSGSQIHSQQQQQHNYNLNTGNNPREKYK